jgi:hypothetical protein
MGNSFLQEQLERVRRLTERVAQAHRVAETSEFKPASEESPPLGPLEEVRDFRTPESPEYRSRADDRKPRSRSTTSTRPARRKRQ